MRNHGEATEIMIMTPKVEKTVMRNEFVNKGIFSSTASMSYSESQTTVSITVIYTFENLFSSLPRGVVSKNDIGDRSMLDSIPSWSLLEALTVPKASVNDANSSETDCTIPNVAYMPRLAKLHVHI